VSECLMVCKSLTYAQRTLRVLERAGFFAVMVRLPRELRDGSGCGYCIKIRRNQLKQALTAIRGERLPDVRVYCRGADGEYTEAVL